MKTNFQKVEVERFSVVTARPFGEVVDRLAARVGHPDMVAFNRDMATAKTSADLKQVVFKAVGSHGMMEFIRFNMGEVLRMEQGDKAPRIQRFVIGNPLIMKEMAKHVPDAASYAPVTILIAEYPDGVHLSYDRMASYLAPYKNAQALKVATDLDNKIETLLLQVAESSEV
jgi:uncharacterized protein (DUF302 family)